MSHRRHLWFVGCEDIRVDYLRVESTNTLPDQREGFGAYLATYEFEHGFAFHECHRVVVRDCSTYGTWGDGLYIGNLAPSTDIRVSRLKVQYNGRQGVAISHADGVVLNDIRIMNTRRAGFDLEPSSSKWHVRNVEIRNSYTHGYHFNFAAAGRGDVSDIFIHHNILSGPGGVLMCRASDGTRRNNWRVEDNVRVSLFGSPQAALRFHHVNNVIVSRNVFPITMSQSRRCTYFEDCHGELEVCDNDWTPGGINYPQVESDPVVNMGNQPIVAGP
jgi:hypothetical protein